MSSIGTQAANQWLEAAEEDGGATEVYSALQRVLGWTLSDEAETGVAYRNDQPVVVAIEGLRLICVSPSNRAARGPEAQIAIDSIPLDVPLRVELIVCQITFGASSYLVKHWVIGSGGADPFVVDTRTPISAWRGGEHDGRAIVEKAVAKLGWCFPQEG
jgi:hypothetical protein